MPQLNFTSKLIELILGLKIWAVYLVKAIKQLYIYDVKTFKRLQANENTLSFEGKFAVFRKNTVVFFI